MTRETLTRRAFAGAAAALALLPTIPATDAAHRPHQAIGRGPFRIHNKI